MKKLVTLCLSVIVCVSGFMLYASAEDMAPAMIFKFDTAENISKFATSFASAEIGLENDAMKVSIKGGDPYITHKFTEENTYADDYRYVKYRFKTSALPSIYRAEFYYKTEMFDTMGADNTYCRIALNGDDEWRTVIIDMKEVGGKLWSGKLEVFRIDPLDAHDRSVFNAGDTAYVDYLAFFATRAEAEAYNGENAEEWTCPDGIEPEHGTTADKNSQIVWEFETEAEIEKWVSGGTNANKDFTNQIVGLSNGILGLWDDDDNFNFKYNLPTDEQFTLEEFPYLKIRYRQNHANSVMQIYFWNDLQGGNPLYNLHSTSSDEWQTVIVDFSSGTAPGMADGFTWKGVLTSLRFDPMREFKQNNPRQCYVDYIGFFKTREDADSYAADRDTEFGKNSVAVLRYAKQRVVIPADTLEKYFDAYDYVIPYDKVQNIHDDFSVLYNEKKVPIACFNSKLISFMSLGKGEYTYEKSQVAFNDTADHWGEDYITAMSVNGLFNGTDENEFSPDMPLTRAMFITVLGRFADADISDDSTDIPFFDVNFDEYYAPYVDWALRTGLIDGADLFRPEEPITRLETASIIDKFMLYSDFAFDQTKKYNVAFTDISTLSDDDRSSIERIAAAGIINGVGDNRFDFEGKLTRAEAATIFTRLTKSLLHISAVGNYVIYDAQEMTVPYWKGNTVYYESFLPVREVEGEEIEIRLLYDIDSVISLKNSFLDTEYEYGKDYTVRDGKLYIPTDSTIKCVSYDEYHPLQGKYFNSLNGGYLFTGGNGVSHSKQYAVTYTHSDKWNGEIPTENPEKLQKFKEKLRAGEEVTIALFGDSISTGCDSSGLSYINLPPFLPKYINLVAECLEDKYGGTVNVINRSVGGKYASWAAEQATNLFGNDTFDLFVIAFGMNDGTLKVEGSAYKEYIDDIMQQILKINPSCEFLLVSTTLPNPESTYAKYLSDGTSYHESYEPLLEELATKYGDNTEMFKLTSMHNYMLTRKRFVDFTSSNINHPNDFLIRLYAQGIIELIG